MKERDTSTPVILADSIRQLLRHPISHDLVNIIYKHIHNLVYDGSSHELLNRPICRELIFTIDKHIRNLIADVNIITSKK